VESQLNIESVPYCIVDWNSCPVSEHDGESGKAIWRMFEKGNVRARIVEYSAGYLADHWCSRGHVIIVLEGEIISELKDGTKSHLRQGMGYVASDDSENQHRSYSPAGAKLFIVD
jgi:hypothetical protein